MNPATQPELLSTSLYFTDAGSDKEYHAKIEASGSGYVVNFAYGRRGAALTPGSKTSSPVAYEAAVKIYDKLVKEKMAKGYTPQGDGVAFAMTEKSGDVSGLLPQLLNPIDDVELVALLNSPDYVMQEKYDGRRMMVRKVGDTIEGNNRKGLVVSLPQEIATAIADMPNCILDGELVGSIFYVFDCISLDGEDISKLGYVDRYSRLLAAYVFRNSSVRGVYTAHTPDHKKEAFSKLKEAGVEGVVFKLKSTPYRVGRPNKGGDQLKYKFYDTLSAVVCKVNAQRSVALCLDGVNVGNVTISPNFDIPQVGDVVEIRYLYAYKGGSLYQPIYLGKRDDIDASECTMAQVKFKSVNNDADEE